MMSDIILHHKLLDDNTAKPVLSLVYTDGIRVTYLLGLRIRGSKRDGKRPVSVEWYDSSKYYMPTDSEIKWLYSELPYVLAPKTNFNEMMKGLLHEY